MNNFLTSLRNRKPTQDAGNPQPKNETLEQHQAHCKAKPGNCPFDRILRREDDQSGLAGGPHPVPKGQQGPNEFPDDTASSHAHMEYDPNDLKAIDDLTKATEQVNQKIEQGDTSPNLEATQALVQGRMAFLTLAKRHPEYQQTVMAFIEAGATGFTQKLEAVPQPAKEKVHAQMAMA